MSSQQMIELLSGMIETYNKIVRLQARAINSLFALLHQYISASELDELPAIKDINEAARLRREMEAL